ncbi:hypothetical protein DFP73DRAFT_524276 [Morchella snyderi]|nr:hypothetical protein DFP73DRAFT_524276 [Morchella snyderi]
MGLNSKGNPPHIKGKNSVRKFDLKGPQLKPQGDIDVDGKCDIGKCKCNNKPCQRFGDFANPTKKASAEAHQHSTWRHITDAETPETFLSRIRRLDLLRCSLEGDKALAHIARHYINKKDHYTRGFDNALPRKKVKVVEDFFDLYINNLFNGRNTCFWIHGRSHTGKTDWVQAGGYHSILRGTFYTRNVQKDADFHILDDMPISEYQNYYKGLFQGQAVTLTAKWVRLFNYKAGRQNDTQRKCGISFIATSNLAVPDDNINTNLDFSCLRANVTSVEINYDTWLEDYEEDKLYEPTSISYSALFTKQLALHKRNKLAQCYFTRWLKKSSRHYLSSSKQEALRIKQQEAEEEQEESSKSDYNKTPTTTPSKIS